MSDFVRISQENGMEATVSRAYAEGTEGVEILKDAAALNSRGAPLAASRRDGRQVKPKTTVEKAAAKKASAKKAASSTADNNSGVAATPEEASK